MIISKKLFFLKKKFSGEMIIKKITILVFLAYGHFLHWSLLSTMPYKAKYLGIL